MKAIGGGAGDCLCSATKDPFQLFNNVNNLVA